MVVEGPTSTSSSTNSSHPLVGIVKHLKPRLRALLVAHFDPKSAAAGAPSSSHRARRRGRLTAGWGLLLAAMAAGALLLNVFGSQDYLLGGASGRRQGLRAAGGTRGGVLLPRRAVKQVLYDCGAIGAGSGCAASGLLVLQTSDGQGAYARMLDATQGVQLAYAQQWGVSYLRWDGLAKGRQAWHATYNRIYLLHELYRLRHQHRYRWVLFMDPDAVFTDPALSVEDLLDERFAVIGCRGGDDPSMWWDLNIGVAFFNLRHPDFGGIISKWLWAIRWVPEARMQKGSTETYVGMIGAQPVKDDQQMFHHVMEGYGPVKGPRIVKRYMDGAEATLFNYGEGKYVAHLIRADNKDQGARLAELLGIKSAFFKKLAALEAERAAAAARAVERRRRQQQEQEVVAGTEVVGDGGVWSGGERK